MFVAYVGFALATLAWPPARDLGQLVAVAAAVMIGVFSIFGTLSTIDMKQMGVGLATAILIDATLIRAVVLPALMTALGRANWWTPRFLRRATPVEPPAEPKVLEPIG